MTKKSRAKAWFILAVVELAIILGGLTTWLYVSHSKSSATIIKPSCAKPYVKGNINSSGDKIYHLPWDSDYNRTVINTKSGERMFCSEQGAKDAGWRHTNAPALDPSSGDCQAVEACWKAVNGVQ